MVQAKEAKEQDMKRYDRGLDRAIIGTYSSCHLGFASVPFRIPSYFFFSSLASSDELLVRGGSMAISGQQQNEQAAPSNLPRAAAASPLTRQGQLAAPTTRNFQFFLDPFREKPHVSATRRSLCARNYAAPTGSCSCLEIVSAIEGGVCLPRYRSSTFQSRCRRLLASSSTALLIVRS